jgi:shikimate kinase
VKLLCLTGFMGCGKSTVARLLARQIGCHWLDLDQQIVERAGMDIPAIFSQLGEPAFRTMEHEELAGLVGQAGTKTKPVVISLGGGTLAQPQNRELLAAAGATIVWLDCPVEELLRRCARITNRPLFRDEASFRRLYQERLPSYQVAHHRVVAAVEPLGMVEQILTLGILEGVPLP